MKNYIQPRLWLLILVGFRIMKSHASFECTAKFRYRQADNKVTVQLVRGAK